MILRSLILLWLLALPAIGHAQQVVSSTELDDVSVTIYRDPSRNGEPIELSYLQGFALVSETRTFDIPKGASTIRFEGVADGMIAVSAVVTGLPGGVMQKNRSTALLSPASLIDGTLGNRVTIRRTNPATGLIEEQDAIIRTGPNQGVLLQMATGIEALRCSGLPETLVYDGVPDGLFAKPTLSVDTYSPSTQRVTVTLSYLANGFDWSANYVGRLDESGENMDIISWITLANSNLESFHNSQVMAVAGTLNVVPQSEDRIYVENDLQLNLSCYPQSSTADGTPVNEGGGGVIVVTGSRRQGALRAAAPMALAMSDEVLEKREAELEALGDLKLYRVPFRSTVAANAQKQVALLNRKNVPVQRVYTGTYDRNRPEGSFGLAIELRMRNTDKQGLGLPLPSGGISVFQPLGGQMLLIGEAGLEDHAIGQRVEFTIGRSAQVQMSYLPNFLTITNANPEAVAVEIAIPASIRRLKTGKIIKRDGTTYWSVNVPANGEVSLEHDLSR